MVETGADGSQGGAQVAGESGVEEFIQRSSHVGEAVGNFGPDDVGASEPDDSFSLLNQEYRAMRDAHVNQFDASYEEELKLLRRRVTLLIEKRGGKKIINESDDREGIDLIGLLNNIDESIAGILSDANENRERKEDQYPKERVAEIIDILRQFDQIRKNLPRLITQLKQKNQDLAENENLEAIYQSFTGFNLMFERLVGDLFDNQSGLVAAIMSGTSQLDAGQLMAATSCVNMNVERRNYCLSMIKNRIIEIDTMLSKMNPKLPNTLMAMSESMRNLKNRAMAAF